MAFLFFLLGFHELVCLTRDLRRGQALKAACLGAGLILASFSWWLAEHATLSAVLEWTAMPLMLTALVLAYRDGSLQWTFLCWTRNRDARGVNPTTPASPPPAGGG